MLTKILPTELVNLIKQNFNFREVYEIRIRRNLPIVVNVAGKFFELKNSADNKIMYADKRLLDYIVLRATESSMYCYNNQLKNCFFYYPYTFICVFHNVLTPESYNGPAEKL